MSDKYQTDKEKKQARFVTQKRYRQTKKSRIEQINDQRRNNGQFRLSKQEMGAIGGEEIAPRQGEEKSILPVRFLAWDGEGVTLNGKHTYILLQSSLPTSLIEPTGIDTESALWYLTEVARLNQGYVHIAYAFTYDANMILRDIPQAQLERLHKRGRVYWKNYSIEYHPKKSITIKRYPEDMFILKHGKKRTPEASICIWDVFGFFGSSFLNALKDMFTPEEKEELRYNDIKIGKERRSDFSQKELENFIIPYCKLEVLALVRLMDRMYNQYCIQAGIRLSRFDGSGAIAASILKKRKVKQFFGSVEETETVVTSHHPVGLIPFQCQVASRHSYSGGRIELFRYGHYNGLFWRYDLCSAYPSVMPELVNYSNGSWVHVKKPTVIHPHSLYLVRWKYPQNRIQPFYPFFYRSDKGNISYPSMGMGWYHTPEVETAFKWNGQLQGEIELLEEWTFYPNDDIRPFDFVRDMYKTRQTLKRAGNGQNIVWKLAYNSFYGKMIQKLGYEQEALDGNFNWRPPYFQLQYASYITSATRAKLFDASMQYPQDIIAVATDGLWSTKRLDLPISDELGQWEEEELHSGTFVQAGVYWTHGWKEKKQEVPCPFHGDYCAMVQHYRGFDRELLTEQRVLDAWKNGLKTLEVPCTRFVTLGSGLSGDRRFLEDWHEWITIDRILQLYPIAISGKRSAIEKHTSPFEGLVSTIPNDGHIRYNGREVLISDAYPLPWTNQRLIYNLMKEGREREYELRDSIDDKYL